MTTVQAETTVSGDLGCMLSQKDRLRFFPFSLIIKSKIIVYTGPFVRYFNTSIACYSL